MAFTRVNTMTPKKVAIFNSHPPAAFGSFGDFSPSSRRVAHASIHDPSRLGKVALTMPAALGKFPAPFGPGVPVARCGRGSVIRGI